MVRYWWVNQNQTYKAEVGGGYMWSPKRNRDNGFNEFYQNMTKLSSGDLVFSFADTFIKAVGKVSARARSAERPKEFGNVGNAWDVDGWLAQVAYEVLDEPIRPRDHMDILAPHLPNRYSPIRPDGRGNQVYLAEISESMADKLASLIGRRLDEMSEDSQSREIQNRTDIGATEKYQLVLSRLGQGRYRSNLERFENRCRITGITDRRFLTASHIKPWSRSTDSEKLDGNNGLLLSPHIDRLFDRGYISFENDGAPILSSVLPSDVSSAWRLSEGIEKKLLNEQQSSYMDYHRENIFRGRKF
ncbi:HNH endonuclease [Fuscibacter oryzae]|uniref:HNH endonuclease n=1 Tax=Fuscibacter oryzae TaxID=2803939 RepID=A0A8J7MS60_9RHOB|nr:HNH endonuclease [Fuscibacter oryzae]MBL4927940.1 HNH endonuclease [Fuscibacter oryzae]